MKNHDVLSHRDADGQLRLALTELGRLEQEIAELTQRAREPHDHELLRALRACRASLLRMAQVRMGAGQTSTAPKREDRAPKA